MASEAPDAETGTTEREPEWVPEPDTSPEALRRARARLVDAWWQVNRGGHTRRTRIYLSGPMTGYSDFNRGAFRQVQLELESHGFEVFNPGTQPPGLTWAEYMKADLLLVLNMKVDDESPEGVVVTLPDWEYSTGAKLEVLVARSCGIEVIHWGEDGALGRLLSFP